MSNPKFLINENDANQEQNFIQNQKLLPLKKFQFDSFTGQCGYLRLKPCSEKKIRQFLRVFINICECSCLEFEHWLINRKTSRTWSILKYVSSAKCTNIFLSKWSSEYRQLSINVQKNLARIHFPCLQKLKLSGKNINGIEMIAFLDAPILETLEIEECYVSSIKAITKSHFKRLKDLKILLGYKSVLANDFSSLSRVTVSQEAFELKTVYDIYNHKIPKMRFGSFQYMFKLHNESYKETAGFFITKIIKTNLQDAEASLLNQQRKWQRLTELPEMREINRIFFIDPRQKNDLAEFALKKLLEKIEKVTKEKIILNE